MSVEAIQELLCRAPVPEPCDRTALMLGLRALALPAEAAQALGALCERAGDDPYHRFACHVRDRLRTGEVEAAGDWPDAGEDADLAAAYLLAWAASLEAMELRCSQAGFDDAAIAALRADIAWWVSAYHRRHGRWGLREIGWCKRHMVAGLLPVGRLQYEPKAWHRPAVVLRHRSAGRYAVLAGNGEGIGADDHLAADEQVVRRSIRRRGGDAWLAHRCRREGGLAAEPERFADEAWQTVLEPDGPVLSLHIPATGPMDAAAIAESFAQAQAVIPRIWPERARVPLVCDSWLLDRQLQTRLKPGANICTFQDRFLNAPDGPPRDDNLRFAFDLDRSPADWRTLEPQGSLQCAIIDHLAAGGDWRGGRGIRPWPWDSDPVQV